MRWVRPFGRWVGYCIIWIGIPLGVAQTIASPVLAYGLFGFAALDKLPHPVLAYAWSYYLWNYPNDRSVQRWATYSGLGAVAVVALLMAPLVFALVTRRQRVVAQRTRHGDAPEPDRAWSNVFGSARWMRLNEAAKLYRKRKPDIGGIPIVELDRVDLDRSIAGVAFEPDDSKTWGNGGKRNLVIDPMRKGKLSNGVIIGPPGAGKSAGFSAPALHHYHGAMVVNDPSGEMSRITAAWREEMGHQCAIIDPAFPALGAFNILKTIDLSSSMAIMQIKAFVSEASGPSKADATKEDAFFKTKGLALNTALLADLLFDPTAEHTVREWRRRIVTPEREMKDRMRAIYAHTRDSYSRDVVGELMDTYHETLSGIRSHATGDTEWLSLAPLADLLSEDTWDPVDLRNGKRTVYLQFPSDHLEADPSVARVVIGSLMRSVMQAKGRIQSQVPFVIDETYQLKYMRILATARDEGRKFGVPLYTMWQSEGQIDEVWGPHGKKAWFNTAAWRMYMGGVDDPATAKELSDACGSYTAIVPTEGTSRSMPGGIGTGRTTRGTNAGYSLQARKLISDAELRTRIRADECIVLWKHQHPGRFGIPYWQRRKDMARDLQANPFLNEREETPA